MVNGTLTTHSVHKVNVSKAVMQMLGGSTVVVFTRNGRRMNCGQLLMSVVCKIYCGWSWASVWCVVRAKLLWMEELGSVSSRVKDQRQRITMFVSFSYQVYLRSRTHPHRHRSNSNSEKCTSFLSTRATSNNVFHSPTTSTATTTPRRFHNEDDIDPFSISHAPHSFECPITCHVIMTHQPANKNGITYIPCRRHMKPPHKATKQTATVMMPCPCKYQIPIRQSSQIDTTSTTHGPPHYTPQAPAPFLPSSILLILPVITI